MDCENCHHLTVVGLHDSSPRSAKVGPPPPSPPPPPPRPLFSVSLQISVKSLSGDSRLALSQGVLNPSPLLSADYDCKGLASFTGLRFALRRNNFGGRAVGHTLLLGFDLTIARLVVEASASRAEDSGFDSLLRHGDFSRR